MNNEPVYFWITDERWSHDLVQSSIPELRELAHDFALQTDGECEPAIITADQRYVYANGERIGQLTHPSEVGA